MKFVTLVLICYAWILGSPVLAQVGLGPQQLPLPPAIPAPQDIPYKGVIEIAVDATDTAHKIYSVHETLPVQHSGLMVLLYPQWDSGSHAATGPIASLAGLFVHAKGQRLEWRRDPVNVFAFAVDVPPGTATIEVEFQYLSPVGPRGGAVSISADLLTVPWQNLMLYPAGYYVRNLPVRATLLLPTAFEQASSLERVKTIADRTEYKETTIEHLADSPVYAGRYFKEIELTKDSPSVYLDLFGDKPEDLNPSESQLASLRLVVRQTLQMFRSAHYAHYNLLVSLSDLLPGGGGLEHLESSEVNLAADFFRNSKAHLSDVTLFPHEYVHSWNGFYRQPADLWTANFNTPMRDSLLWVYEGQTEFWGMALSARSGLLAQQEVLDLLAMDAATAEAHTGRAWKSLQDSNNDPLFDAGHSVPWKDWQRREDYYGEGVLLWLDVDSLIRSRTGGAKSLSDFARAFFAGVNGSTTTQTYTFDDVCRSLSSVTAYDWAGFLRARLETHSSEHLLDGLKRAGYQLVYKTTPTEAYRQHELEEGVVDLSFSIGLTVDERGVIKSVAWDKPSFRAGLGIGARILSINDAPFATAKLQEAVAKAESTPINITYSVDGAEHAVSVSYKGGLRYPRFERIPGTPDLLIPLLSIEQRPSESK